MPHLFFSTHFLPGTAGPFEFLDIDLNEDIEVFIDPFLIANNRRERLVRQIYEQLTHFFTTLNRTYIQTNDRLNGLIFLSPLHEPNEYHLGYSDSNKGKAIADEKAEEIFNALRGNRFTRSGAGITNEAHNVLLLVKGIGQDIMSDTIANVCRNLFANFTTAICNYYNIPTVLTEIEFYDRSSRNWATMNVQLPQYNGKKIILVPNISASGKRAYTSHYNRFVAANHIAPLLLNGTKSTRSNPKTIRTLSNGTRKAVIKEIQKTYKKKKKDLIDFVTEYQGSLDGFLQYVKDHYPAVDISNFH